ncbi:hypothetical protein MIND_00263500 [Mycena indigotica]|uniref:Uncharacterized protein n=1 Tax=Mycena indigotica TaxID=2126181 RepID=A0A8H6WF42_9AGAR|nr:uncharacterized protein MIND_00263500 [Mycena indigotica]KAF7312498.1 hypothetical protein MIND_00263500 [Mycena indigotica]
MHSRPVVAILAACVVVLSYLFWRWQYLSLEGALPAARCSLEVADHSTALSTPQRRFRVAVASYFGFHFDVYMALVWTLERVMAQSGAVEVYAEQPFGFDFQNIVDDLRLYRGAVKPPDRLVSDIRANMGTGGIDLVVLGTCEVDLRGQQHQDLLDAWDARSTGFKFKIVCIVHNIEDYDWQVNIPEWSRRNAIRILPISEHAGPSVASAFKQMFLVSADSANDTLRLSRPEDILIDVHVPVLDIPSLKKRQPRHFLSDAVIQGSFFSDRRDYVKIFAELNESLSINPKVWGYLSRQTQDVAYRVDESLPDPPFRLFLIGSGYIEIPPELENLVVVRDGLSYPEFYALMSQMDICIPAFSVGNDYYDVQASSTFAMAVECDVPILVTERIKKAYAYADDPRAVVTRPAAMREVEALRALRTGDVTHFLQQTRISPESSTAQGAKRMVQQGWVRSAQESRSFKEGVWAANERVVERILHDL